MAVGPPYFDAVVGNPTTLLAASSFRNLKTSFAMASLAFFFPKTCRTSPIGPAISMFRVKYAAPEKMFSVSGDDGWSWYSGAERLRVGHISEFERKKVRVSISAFI